MTEPETTAKLVGRRLRTARMREGMTVREAAEVIGMSHATLVKYENGTLPLPIDRAAALARAYNIPPATLLVEDDALARLLEHLLVAPALLSQLEQALTHRQ
jgi:transcriptional regulator with XRE-family HTH domain